MSTLFSVLIANYNGGKYLRDCIDSVLAQTYPYWEIVLVDDGSTDNSHTIYDEYAFDQRIHIYKRVENKGCTYTKSECIFYAKGELCGFLDADDMLVSDALTAMVLAHKEERVSIVSSRYQIIDEQGQLSTKCNRLLDLNGQSYLERRDYSPEHFVSFKKCAYDSTKGLDLNHKIGDDQELYLLLEEVGDWKVLDKILYHYRVYSNSISRRKTFECYYWNMIVRYEACIRRRIDPMLYSYKDYQEALDAYVKDIKHQTEIEIRSSRAYLIGKALLRPFKFLKR